MKKNNSTKRGPPEPTQAHTQPDKVGWIRKFCGKGIFREIWKNRFVALRGEQLFISEREVKEEKRFQEVVDLADYDRSEELRKSKSRSKKNHSKFTLLRCRSPGNTVPNLVFLAVSPEEKESWINALNSAITRAKNRILDEVTVADDRQLSHMTRDRVKIPHSRRLPTRGHLLAVASKSSSDGMLTLDLIQDDDAATPPPERRVPAAQASEQQQQQLTPDFCPRSKTCLALSDRTAETAAAKSQSLPRDSEGKARISVYSPQPDDKRLSHVEKQRCASADQILTHSSEPSRGTEATADRVPTLSEPSRGNNITQTCSDATTTTGPLPVGQLQELIKQKLSRTQELLSEVQGGGGERDEEEAEKEKGARTEAERLLKEALSTWDQAREVLREVTELRQLCKQMDVATSSSHAASLSPHPSSRQNTYRKSLM